MGKLNWKGETFLRDATRALAEANGEIALAIETEAKRELYPGHGVDSGTLKRSIHVAQPGYNWARDNVKPSPRSPERGGRLIRGLDLTVGSGMVYALAVHQGKGNFTGYHYLTRALERVLPRRERILAKHLRRFAR